MTTIDFIKKDIPIDLYRKMKMKMLNREFGIVATEAEKERMNSMKTEIAIDRYFHKILGNHWG